MLINDIEVLHGGNMASPKLIGDKVYRTANSSTKTIQRLLTHIRSKGIDWVPIPYGINEKNEEVLSYIIGDVPHLMPEWIWANEVLEDVAIAQRQLHDSTADFSYQDEIWQIETKTDIEVICHNDLAPYNVVFENKKIKGLIDFDLCAPGSRLWDIAYTLYRFVPVMPQEKIEEDDEASPFNQDEMFNRINIFISKYASGDIKHNYSMNDILDMISLRLKSISEWTEKYAVQSNNEKLMKNAKMYNRHSIWISKIKCRLTNVVADGAVIS